MSINTVEETTSLILAGEGYQLTIAPEAEERKLVLLGAASGVTSVTSNDESADAQVVSRRLAQMRIEVEKSRKLVKEPVNRIGKLIDATAKNFIDALEAEEKRITRLVGTHANEVERIRQEKLREEARVFEEARRAREEAERKAAEADEARENKASISEVIAARKAAEAAEAERQATLAARMEASAEVAGTKVAEGVRFAVDFEIVDVSAFLTANSHLCEITVRRADTLAWLKEWLAEDQSRDRVASQAGGLAVAGIRVFKKPVVSSR